MKTTTFLAIAFGLLNAVAKGQTLNLNNCIKLQKNNRVTINQILQSKNSKWEFSDGMWQYDDGMNTTFIRKTEGD